VRGSEPAVYVATNGSDSGGDGTEQRPFRSLSRAAETAVPGTTIFVRGGIYEAAKEEIRAQGTASEPIVIQPYPGETAVFDGGGANIGDAESIIKISQSSYVIFEGFEVRNSKARGLSVYESDHVTVRGNRVHETVQRGLGGGGSDLVFEDNEVWRASLENENEAFNAGGGWKAGFSTYKMADGSPSRRITIRRNHIHDNWGEGIIAIFAEDVIIEGNELHDNYSVNLYLDNARRVLVQGNHIYTISSAYNRRDKGYPAHGIHMANEKYASPTDTAVREVLISNNLIVGTGRGISFWQDSRNNNRDNSYQGIIVAYNVIQGTHDASLWFDDVAGGFNTPSDNRLHNNIVFMGQNGHLFDLGNPEGWTISHNNWPDRIPGVADEPNSFSALPSFADPRLNGPATGYQLRLGDRSIGAGLPLTMTSVDYWGRPRSAHPSLGIYEYLGSDGDLPITETPTGEPPTPTATDAPPTATVEPTATLEPTATAEPTVAPSPTAVPHGSWLLVSSSDGGQVGEVAYEDEDVLAFDLTTGQWSLFFDGSDVGLNGDVDGVALLPGGNLLLSLDRATTVPGLGRVDDSDLIAFMPLTLGEETSGTFAWYFDGSDVGLTRSDEDVDGVALLADGRLLLSTTGDVSVDGVRGKDEDLLLFSPTSLGEVTNGRFELYFDGSDVGLAGTDLWGAWLEPFSQSLYLSTKNDVTLPNLTASNRDVFVCRLQAAGGTTACEFSPTLFWQGGVAGLNGRLDALTLQTGGVAMANVSEQETAVSIPPRRP
ncbi:MAG: right-handed parallel beta-helix repeat-containing protein, partial [Anaerolineales bacterium]|nr:right-handed parallel beta-helix repeat-containing protein [Anaerolineales bacterium]